MAVELPKGELSPEEKSVRESFWNRKERLSELLTRLQKNEVGRAIVSGRFNHRRLIGYILPLDPADDSHLFIFENGFLAITVADEVEQTSQIYKLRTGRNLKDYVTSEERPTDILRVLNLHPTGEGARKVGRVILTNDTSNTASKFKEAAEKALVMARLNLLERRGVLMGTTDPVLDTLSSMLGQGILT